MRELFRLFAFQLGLHKGKYTGSTEVQWKDGEVRFVRTESGRTPDELPGEQAELVEVLAQARSGSA